MYLGEINEAGEAIDKFIANLFNLLCSELSNAPLVVIRYAY